MSFRDIFLELNSIEWIIFIISCLGFIYQILLIIGVLWLLYHKKYFHRKCDIVITGVFALILYATTTIWFISFFLNGMKDDVLFNHQNGWFVQDIWEIIWNVAQISCYLLFFYRLKYTYESRGHYSVSKGTRNIIYCCVIVYILFDLLLLPMMFEMELNIDDKMEREFALIYGIGINVINIVITVVISYIFIQKLYNVSKSLRKLFQMRSKSHYGSSISIELSSSNKLSGNRRPSQNMKLLNRKSTSMQLITLLNLMSKLFILCGTMIISTQMVMITIILVPISTLAFPDHFKTVAYCYYITRNIDCIITSTCIYFTFNEYDSKYIFCCKWPHIWIRDKCTHKSVKMSFDTMYDRICSHGNTII